MVYPAVKDMPGIKTNEEIIQQAAPLGPHPSIVVCPICKASMQTLIGEVASTKVHLCAFFCCFIGCVLKYQKETRISILFLHFL